MPNGNCFPVEGVSLFLARFSNDTCFYVNTYQRTYTYMYVFLCMHDENTYVYV